MTGPKDSQQDQDDRRYMALALALARRGWGSSAPNPAVGAVVVAGKGDEALVLGRGWTQTGGRPHAETEALRRAGKRSRGATLYVTLEPCAHYGKTPPCADAVIAAGIARVVIGTGDPDKRVAGEGIARLRAAGIDVVEAVPEDEALWVSAGHILRAKHGRPFVQLKMAVSRDGRIAPGTGATGTHATGTHATDTGATDTGAKGTSAPVWVTGLQARARGHLMRAQADAILVGRGTVAADDPHLGCRLPGLAAGSPVRVVLDSALKTAVDAAVVATAHDIPTWFMAARPVGERRRKTLERAGATVIEVDAANGRPAVMAVLAALAEAGITRLLVEGGPQVSRSFLAAGLVDEVVIFRGIGLLGTNGIAPLVDSRLDVFEDGTQWRRETSRILAGGDSMSVFRSRTTFSASN